MPTTRIQPGLYRGNGINNRADVLVGNPDRYGTKVGPCLRASRFGGRVPMGLDCDDVEPTDIVETVESNGNGKLVMDMSRGTQPTGRTGEIHRAYRKADGLEYEIEWDSLSDVPASRKVTMTMDVPDGLTWHYQPALTSEEIEDGDVRPDNVVGSYAIYWNQSGRFTRNGIERVNYETGKFAHLYRPELIDSTGINRCWAEQSYNPVTKKLTLDFSACEDWLQSALGSITLDPTFGYTSIGATQLTNTVGYANVFASDRHVAASGEVIISYHVYGVAQQNASTLPMTAYEFNGSLPTNRIGANTIISFPSSASGEQWWSAVSSNAMNGGTEYVVACGNGGSLNRLRRRFDTVTAGARGTASTLPDPFVDTGSFTRRFSWYATYEEAATGRVPYELYFTD